MSPTSKNTKHPIHDSSGAVEGNVSALRTNESDDAASVSHRIGSIDKDSNVAANNTMVASTDNISGTVAVQTGTKTSIRDDSIETPWWYATYEEVWLSSVFTPKYCAENKRMSALLLHIKKNEMNRSVSVYAARGGKSNVSFGTNDSFYARIFLFGCLGTDDCFVILSKSARKSRFLLESFTDKELSVGETVMLLEPTFTGQGLGKDESLPILDVKKKLEPFSFRTIPTVKYQIPEEPGTRYFLLQGMHVEITTPIMQRSSCGGYLCDRQPLKTNEKACCCLFNAVQTSLVLEVSVSVLETSGSTVMSMESFRSWVLTKLFIRGLNLASKMEDFHDQNEVRMRNVIHAIVHYVNNHGGWDVYGWMRRGSQVDAGEKGSKICGEEITAENVSPHIIRLMPSIVSLDALTPMCFTKQMLHVE